MLLKLTWSCVDEWGAGVLVKAGERWKAMEETEKMSWGEKVPSLPPTIFRLVKPHLLFNGGVSVTRWVVPYQYRKVL